MENGINDDDVQSDTVLSSDFLFVSKDEMEFMWEGLGERKVNREYRKEDKNKIISHKTFVSFDTNKNKIYNSDGVYDKSTCSVNFSSSFIDSPINESKIFSKNNQTNLKKNTKFKYEQNDGIKLSIFEKINKCKFLLNTPEETQIKPENIDLAVNNKKQDLLFNNQKLNELTLDFDPCKLVSRKKRFDSSNISSEKRRGSVLNLRPFHWAILNESNFCNKTFSAPMHEIKKQRNNSINKYWDTIDSGVRHTLEHIGPGKSDSYMRIEPIVLKDLIMAERKDVLVIDCRFRYEYNGGHIKNAININSQTEIENFFKKYLVDNGDYESKTNNCKPEIVIFHCEFSSVRAPRMAKNFRNIDRKHNMYPNLTFPEIYILEGGYKRFFKEHISLCQPETYVAMDAKEYQAECKSEHEKLKKRK